METPSVILQVGQWISKHVRYIVTERDGVSTCWVRTLGGVAAILALIAFGIAVRILLRASQPSLATDIATLIAALGGFMSTIGAVIAWKNGTERDR